MKKLRNKIGGEVKIFTAKWLNSKFDTAKYSGFFLAASTANLATLLSDKKLRKVKAF